MILEFIFIEQLIVMVLAAGLMTAIFISGYPSLDECLARLEAPTG